MSLEEEQRFLLFLSSYYCVSKELVPSREQVLNCIERRNWAMLSGKDLELSEGSQDQAWKVELSQVSGQLFERGLFEASQGDTWSISAAGKEELYPLHEQLTFSFPMKLTSMAIEYADGVFPFA